MVGSSHNIHLPLYQEAIEAGVKTIMVSYSSLNGLQMHENKYMITDILKGEMGFKPVTLRCLESMMQLLEY